MFVVVTLVTDLEPLTVVPVKDICPEIVSKVPLYPAVVTPVIWTNSPTSIPCDPTVSTVAIVPIREIDSILVVNGVLCP